MNAEAKKRYKDIEFPFICPVTKRSFNTSQGLSCYVTKTLKIFHPDYYDKYINHRDSKCFFCGSKGKFISIAKGYRNLCEEEECLHKSFSSHSIEGLMYRNMCSREEAILLFNQENTRQLEERMKSQEKLRMQDKSWDKKRSRNCIEFWLQKGYSVEDAKLKTSEVMREIHAKISLKLKTDIDKYKSKYPTKKEYYLKRGFTEDEAKTKISQIQNRFSKKICIEKYGIEKGQEIWLTRQVKWQKSLQSNGNIKGGFSRISQILFYDIIGKYKDKKTIKDVYFWTKNKEYYIKSEKYIYLYDFVDLNKMKIIEYHGDQYHANPERYTKDEMPHPYHKDIKFTAEKIWQKDKNKQELAVKNGFEILIIWDSEYRKDPSATLEKCLRFLNE